MVPSSSTTSGGPVYSYFLPISRTVDRLNAFKWSPCALFLHILGTKVARTKARALYNRYIYIGIYTYIYISFFCYICLSLSLSFPPSEKTNSFAGLPKGNSSTCTASVLSFCGISWPFRTSCKRQNWKHQQCSHKRHKRDQEWIGWRPLIARLDAIARGEANIVKASANKIKGGAQHFQQRPTRNREAPSSAPASSCGL